MKNIRNIVMASFASLVSSFALADCPETPIGGSEHSFGVPGPVVAQALDTFATSNEVQAQVELLKRHGFCPKQDQAEVVKMSESCDSESGCSYDIVLKQEFKARAFRSKSIVAHYSQSSDGRVLIEAQPLNLRGIGQLVTLPQALSQTVFAGLSAAGINDPREIMGSMRLSVGQLVCSQPVVPNPVPSCTLINYDQSLELDAETAAEMMKFLLHKRAFVGPRNIVGAVNVGAALLVCESGVYPGAQAECTAVIENALN